MAINQVDYPTNLTAQTDFSAHGDLIETRFQDAVNQPIWDISGNIPQGAVFQIGGAVYRADSDTAITGTASDYVKLTPDGAGAADASYVADLTGVSWSAQYNGYYDGSGNLYLFNEGKALAAGEISAVFGKYLAQNADGSVDVGGALNVDGNATVGGSLSAGAVTATTLNTGQGANELYAMNQNVRSTDSPTFNVLNATGSVLSAGNITGASVITTAYQGTLGNGSAQRLLKNVADPLGREQLRVGMVIVGVSDMGVGTYHFVTDGSNSVLSDTQLISELIVAGSANFVTAPASGFACYAVREADNTAGIYIRNGTGTTKAVVASFVTSEIQVHT